MAYRINAKINPRDCIPASAPRDGAEYVCQPGGADHAQLAGIRLGKADILPATAMTTKRSPPELSDRSVPSGTG
jgi:hypothetical protein